MSTLSRRRFLKTTAYAAAGAGVLGTAGALAEVGTSYAVQGIDISHWQGAINWTQVRASGKKFAFCKATEGLDYTDPTFATNWPAMRTAGMLRGSYHMGHPADSAITQANRFFDTVQPSSGDLPLVLDLEKTDNLAPADVRAWVVAFVTQIKSRMGGRAPIIYTGYYFWRDSAGNGSSLGCPLWLAAYNNTPLVPTAWSAFSLWQYSSTGSVSGISGNVDLDACNLSKTALNNLRLP
jgi:lysozyme